ncbi:MAG: hypothetical protein LWX07_00290 [Bacteroidetes bacterium]|nr:hypothetical protein [Bacteroidota bacterium]
MNDFNKIEELIDTGMSVSLREKTGAGFSDKLMREITMMKEFEKQDKKTFKLMNVVVAVAASIILVSGVILAWLIGSGSGDESGAGAFSYLKDGINSFGYKFMSLFGLSPTGDVFVYILIAGIAISVFAVVERFVIRRGYN